MQFEIKRLPPSVRGETKIPARWHVIAQHPKLFGASWQWSKDLGGRKPAAVKIQTAKVALMEKCLLAAQDAERAAAELVEQIRSTEL